MLAAELTIKLIETDHYYTSKLSKVNAALLLGIDPMYVESLKPFIDAEKQVKILVKLYSDLADTLPVFNYISLNDFVTPKAEKLFNSRKKTKSEYRFNLLNDAKKYNVYNQFIGYVQYKQIDLDNLNFESHATLRMIIKKLAA